MNLSAPGNAGKHGVSLAACFAEGPHVAASATAEQRLQTWLAELGPQPAAAIEALLDHPFVRPILAGIGEFSPYLLDLIRADPARLIRLLECDPDTHLASLIDDGSRAVLAASDEADVMRLLRRM